MNDSAFQVWRQIYDAARYPRRYPDDGIIKGVLIPVDRTVSLVNRAVSVELRVAIQDIIDEPA